ncbi:SRPBCC domain-containing protein [Rathayibacter oskolensis]|uniref:SRPBCC domain-containing protein n=1 Tax=Rathayibacter TaxID=33886 RepID=UPI0013196C48|nr:MULTISPECIES: SRPBCC domain-containing protein [Rathayibacter]QHC65984.1 SRPBCC domain-containing protein [Rathayibacter sp. VKM Ac-2759]WKK70780.1 SRPBCC domain-containing protein [Rathayibacter oskolensis]
MSIVLATTVDISATPDEVWEVLSDFSAYGEWSNFSRIDGSPELGTTLRMRMPGFWFSSTVTAVDEGRELQWSAKLLSAGLFLGEHSFLLSVTDEGTTRVHNTETFSGALTRPFEGFFAGNHSDGGYAAFNQSLKSRVEARVLQASRAGTAGSRMDSMNRE